MLVSGCGNSGSNEIKIGALFELTGGQSAFGTSSLNGVSLALKEINAKGGLLGKKLVLVNGDNKSEPSEAANAITKLITQDKVVAVVGSTTSSNTIAASAVAMSNKVPLISPVATNPRVTVDDGGKVKDYVFRACFIDPFQGTVGANYASKSLKAKTAAIYVDNSSDYSKGLAKFFREAFTKAGGEIVAEEAYLQKDQDFKATLTKIKSTNPDVIYVPGYYEEVGKIIKQARELGVTVAFLGGDGWDSPKLPEIAGADVLNNTYFTSHYSPEDKNPIVATFVDKYKKDYGIVPDAYAALGYDTMMLLADAITRAGSTDADKIKDALVAAKGFKAVTGDITINKTHDADKSAVILEFKEGKQVYKDTVSP
ncbi:MAG: ABC transporter substrate-binding protein [Negativicutes bacterium]|nr:ABC transporter substrate-binding protein [Negativicutes bacterium]